MHAGQSTDAENSRSPLKVSKDGSNAVRTSSLGSPASLSKSSRTGLSLEGADQTFQNVPAGS